MYVTSRWDAQPPLKAYGIQIWKLTRNKYHVGDPRG